METLTLKLNKKRFLYILKRRKSLEIRFNLKIILPEVFNVTCTIVSLIGEKQNIQEFKDLLNEKFEEPIDDPFTSDSAIGNPSKSNSIPVVTLSDSEDSEVGGCQETPIAKKKKKKKRKFQDLNSSTPLAVGNSSEIEVLNDTTAPPSKCAKTGPAFPSEEYIPLSVTTSNEGARSVKVKPKKRSWATTANKRKHPSATVTSNSIFNNFDTGTHNGSEGTTEDSIVLVDEPGPSTSSNSNAPCNLEDSVLIVDDSVRDDSVLIEDCFVVDKMPSLDDTTVADDSIIEIPISESNIGKKNKVKSHHLTNHKNPVTNHFPILVDLFKNGNNLASHNTNFVQPPLSSTTNLQFILANRNLMNGGLQNIPSGSNLIVPSRKETATRSIPQIALPVSTKLRPIVIDGSNVARDHGSLTKTYSCKGIKISVDFFLKRGHTEVRVFLPKNKKFHLQGPFPTTDAYILDELESVGRITYTPTRRVNGKTVTCYDDRFIVEYATQVGGVIVSNDNYRDIMVESEAYEKTIRERLLMFCFAGDTIMFPTDPLGRDGPRLDQFLTFPPETD